MTDTEFCETTIKLYSGLFDRPKMMNKYLQRPPFKYLFEIFSSTMQVTGFGQGLFNEQEKDFNYYENKERKIMFLRKLIDLTQYAIDKGLQAKASKIVAGHQPENTNILLQQFHRAATTPELSKKGPRIIKKLLAWYEWEVTEEKNDRQVQDEDEEILPQKQINDKEYESQQDDPGKIQIIMKNEVKDENKFTEQSLKHSIDFVPQEQQYLDDKNKGGILFPNIERIGKVNPSLSGVTVCQKDDIQIQTNKVQELEKDASPLGKVLQFINRLLNKLIQLIKGKKLK